MGGQGAAIATGELTHRRCASLPLLSWRAEGIGFALLSGKIYLNHIEYRTKNICIRVLQVRGQTRGAQPPLSVEQAQQQQWQRPRWLLLQRGRCIIAAA